MKIKWLPPRNYSISQIYSNGLEYAFCSKNDQLTEFIFCKDFLHDCLYSFLHNEKIKIYGFKYDPKKSPVDLNKTSLLIANNSDVKMGSKIDGCLDFLNQIEKRLKLLRTKIYECSEPPEKYKNSGVYMFSGSKMWMNSPPMISLYSLLIRIGFCHKKDTSFIDTITGVLDGTISPYQNNDKKFLKESFLGINMILSLGYRKFFYKETIKNYPKSSVDIVHNYYGIIAFTRLFEKPKQEISHYLNHIPKYWHRKSLKTSYSKKIGENTNA